MLILGIETSCDETSVSVVDHNGTVRSNLIASQVARHQPFGGVVPEIASREHLQHLMPLVEQSLGDAHSKLEDIDAIAVTSGPGLIGALLVGVAGAQGLAFGSDRKLVPINHLEGHIFSPYLTLDGPATELPERFLTLVVSGGHSSVYDVHRDGRLAIWTLNRTRDDAAGEIFDKVAKFIGLPYPGGPHVDRLARDGDPERFRFTIAKLKDDSADFSFSGLKASAIRLAREEKISSSDDARSGDLADFCASFQRAISDQIIDRLDRLWKRVRENETELPREFGLAGGVAANGEIRARVAAWCESNGLTVRLAERRYCTDNAAMIAFAGLQKYLNGDTADPRRVEARSRMPVGSAECGQ